MRRLSTLRQATVRTAASAFGADQGTTGSRARWRSPSLPMSFRPWRSNRPSAGVIVDYATLAELAHVSRARISQIMNLLVLAPDIQETLLFLPRTERGRDPIHLRQLQPLAAVLVTAALLDRLTHRCHIF